MYSNCRRRLQEGCKVTMVSINGSMQREDEASISVFDHGFLYGDSAYETIRTYGRKPFLLKEHLQRLSRSCESIEIAMPWGEDRFRDEMARLISHVEGDEYILRVIITRGRGRVGYKRDTTQQPTVVIICSRFRGFTEDQYLKGIRLAVVRTRRNPVECLNPGIKSSNLLNLRLAFQEAEKKGADEALMLNMDGNIAECSSSTVFFVKEGELVTPSIETGILPGITREFTIRLASELSLNAREETVPHEMLQQCEEAFITSTIKSILPVCAIDGRSFSSIPGPVTSMLMKAFDEATKNYR